jgi:hypothetical protein
MEGDPMACLRVLAAGPRLQRQFSIALNRLALRLRYASTTRPAEFSLSFLDVICCGFGAVILLLMITKTVQPQVIEQAYGRC